MKRTTIYFDGDLELRLKAEVRRRKQPMAVLVREAVEAYLGGEPPAGPPGAGAFSSGRPDTASDVDGTLADTGFGGRGGTRKRKDTSRRAKRRV